MLAHQRATQHHVGQYWPHLPFAVLPVFTLVPHSLLLWYQFQSSHWPHSAWRHPSEPGPWPVCARVPPHYVLGPALLMHTLTSQGNKSDLSLCWSIDSSIKCPPLATVMCVISQKQELFLFWTSWILSINWNLFMFPPNFMLYLFLDHDFSSWTQDNYPSSEQLMWCTGTTQKIR